MTQIFSNNFLPSLRNTAKTFYAASIFFEILNQFGEVQPDLEQKQKYAVWKAADIRKAMKEGRKPVPGPPGGDKDLFIPSSTSSGEYGEYIIKDLEPSRTDPTFKPEPESDPSPRSYDEVKPHHTPDIPPSRSNSSPSSSPYPSNYPTHDFHPPPSTNNVSENSNYPQPYHHQSYPQDPQQHIPPNYQSQDIPPAYQYPNFQSYPSFTESSLPAAPSHYPSYYQGSDAPYSTPSAPATATYVPPPQYTNSSSRNGTVPESIPTPTPSYKYDSNYQPSPEKIAEAHKAARFAVGALAFDDVAIAVDHLKKSLELLTNPSAGQ